jgi:hypothetical protein
MDIRFFFLEIEKFKFCPLWLLVLGSIPECILVLFNILFESSFVRVQNHSRQYKNIVKIFKSFVVISLIIEFFKRRHFDNIFELDLLRNLENLRI